MKKISAIFRSERLDHVSQELEDRGYVGFTISDVRGHGQSPEKVGEWRGQRYELHVTHKLLIEIIVEDEEVEGAVAAIMAGAHTGAMGDGLVTVAELTAVYSIRTGLPSVPDHPAPEAAPAGTAEPAAPIV
jgi:nitrogen regulatory protein P-II 1